MTLIELRDGDLAIVRPGGSKTVALAKYNRWDIGPDDDDPVVYWSFFGTEITARPEDVEVVELVTVAPLE